jgi:MoaA/NifB/PqqE/SkfB family radical SAM enzyme
MLKVSLFKKIFQRKKTLKFEVHLASQCNLNCRSCSHFSPLVEREFLLLETFEKDCKRISHLCNKSGETTQVSSIRFMGGEPLLHPDISAFLETGRKYFEKAKLAIVTNGVLLPKQTENFWRSCRNNKVKIRISGYPIKLETEKIKKLSKKFKVKVKNYGTKKNEWGKMKIDISGRQDKENSFNICNHDCVNLCDGKLYSCPTIAYIKYFNQYFGKKLEVKESDYVDIHKVESIDEIMEFLSSPSDFCRYCDIAGGKMQEWGISKKEISEWT